MIRYLGKVIKDYNWTQTQNHLVLKRTLNHLAKLTRSKWLSVCLRTKWFWVRVHLQSLNLQISRLLRARSSLKFRQLYSVDSLWNAYVTWQRPTVKAIRPLFLVSPKMSGYVKTFKNKTKMEIKTKIRII